MNATISASTQKIGYWSAICATVFSLAYVIAQLAEWTGLLGSDGGPQSSSTVIGIYLLLTPSIMLGTAFLVMMVCVQQLSSQDRKIWGQIAVAFATIYTTLISIVYYVQLTLVAPRISRNETEDIEMLLFTPFDSFLYAVDILGYSFMCLSCLFAAFVFTGKGIETTTRWLLIANGLLLPFLAFQMYVHSLIWIASLWAITFPAATWVLAQIFRQKADNGRYD